MRGAEQRVREPILAMAIGLMLLSGCSRHPQPYPGAQLELNDSNGRWETLDPEAVTAIYGIGLSYSRHIEETGSDWDPDQSPPVFRKSLESLNRGDIVYLPGRAAFLELAERTEKGLSARLDDKFPDLIPLVDYEVEIGLVLLEDLDRDRLEDPAYLPAMGFVLCGDFSSRSFMILGEGMPNKMDYWGAAKSFPGFSALGKRMWVPHRYDPESLVAVPLECRINGELRQSSTTADRIYSARQMLGFTARAFPSDPLRAGTVIMTGTPPGVAFQVPAWKQKMADLLRLDRLTRMRMVMKSFRDSPAILQDGDSVVYSAGMLEELHYTIRQAP